MSKLLNTLYCSTLTSLRICTVLLFFFVPISTAIDNLLLAFLLITILLNPHAIWQIAIHNPVARAATLLFCMLLIGVLYGNAPMQEAGLSLIKYIDLAFIPLFMLFLRERRYRLLAINAFLFAMGLTLLLSYLIHMGVILPSWISKWSLPENPAVFRNYNLQSTMTAFAVFLALLKFREAILIKHKLAWIVAALLGANNVLLMLQGRTGYLVLFVLLFWFTWSTITRFSKGEGREYGRLHGIILATVFCGLATIIYYGIPKIHDRVDLVVTEAQSYTPISCNDSSIGARIEFYLNAIEVIRLHPILGSGTGNLKLPCTDPKRQVANPHNEFLFITVQTGIVGLMLLLFLFYTIWRYAPSLESDFFHDAAHGLVLAFTISGMFNSVLHDHADGLLFALMTAAFFSTLTKVDGSPLCRKCTF